MKRREFVATVGTAAGMAPLVGWKNLEWTAMNEAQERSYDVLVVGAGVFGTWTALSLHRAGKRVAILDAVGPAHGGASSGGESRVTRCGYGGEELYTEWACRSMVEWRALSRRASLPLFHEIGVLWVHPDGAEFYEANARMLARHDLPVERLTASRLRERFPVLRVSDDEAGLLEPIGGALIARRAVQHLAAELAASGVEFLHGQAQPIDPAAAESGSLPAVHVAEGGSVEAEAYVFACGPWLDRVCPDAMAGRLFVTRQDVLFFDVDRARTGGLPVWADLPFYGMPSLEGRGFKVADDTHGDEVDPSRIDRLVRQDTVDRARDFLARRFPSLADAPVAGGRVCQYENSSNGDFVLDRHPGLDNVWLAGCGSGHGFKHGPAVGAHVAGLVLGTERPIERFRVATKQTRQEREIQ